MDVSIITSTLVTSTVLLYILIPFPSQYCTAMDTLITSQNISKGQTLVSVGEVFELGFFSPGNSSKLYVGIWYKKTSTSKVVWVANREKPLAAADSSTSLTMGVDGNLRLMDGKLNTVWSTSIVPVLSNKQVAVLLDNGNLVIEDTVSKEKLWESMKNPCDTFLPGMMLGMNTRTGQKQFLTSWKCEDDPSPGNFLLGTKLQVPPQPFIWNGTTLFWRGGPWNGLKFIGMPEMDAIYQNGFRLVSDTREGTEYFTFDALGSSHIRIMFLSASGYLQISQWEEDRKEFEVHWETPQSPCDVYGMCGPYGVCNKNELPICKCLKGFKPKSSTEWSNGNWTGGCVRRTELFCDQNMKTSLASGRGRMDGFWKLSRMILPDLFENYMLPEDAEACSLWCLNNCSCTAYAFVAGIGCMIWTSDLMDIQEFSSAAEDLYLRLAYSELGRKNRAKLIFIVAAVSSFIILVALVYGLRKWKQNTTAVGLLGGKGKKVRSMEDINLFYNPDSLRDRPQGCNIERKDVTELPVIDMDQILVATANFSMANKLGEGGFGPVYKGKLKNGREVAVKRLSSSSVQGFEEFKTEIILISKLQHRNLVRLLGCCIGGEEKLLIYEYMPNKSLDTFLFDPTKRMQLDWAKRFNIIQGIARGLLYLHRDSCLRVIHRDLKASNILLDEHMDPKISDFGLARIFRRTQDLANTDRVVGTFGYMSPEYAMGGIFSEKSDVFSYGILLLEIVSSKKNTGFYYNEQHISILGHAWQLWSEHRELDLVDQALADTNSSSEAARCIHVALLCVQDHAVDRPTMSAVVLMLSGDSELSQPKQPTFSFQSSSDYDLPSQGNSKCSINEVTITTITGR